MKKKIKEIFDGIKNSVITDEQIELLASERIKYCNVCPFKKKNTCEMCGCYINLKVRSRFTGCPLGKWEALKNENNYEL